MIIIFRVPNKFLKLFFLFSLFSSELIWEMPSQTSVLSFFKWKILCLLHRSLGYQEGRNRRSDSKRCKKRWTWWTSSCYFPPICAYSWPRRHFYADFRGVVKKSVQMNKISTIMPLEILRKTPFGPRNSTYWFIKFTAFCTSGFPTDRESTVVSIQSLAMFKLILDNLTLFQI